MLSVRFIASTSSDGVVERDFLVGDIPGVLWSPVTAPDNAPLVLMGHGGGLHKKTPAQVTRARDAVTRWGFHVAAIDAPGHGDRPRTPADDEARAEFREAAADRERFKAASIRYAHSLVERAVPEWRTTIDALAKELPDIGKIGYGGGISMGTAIGVPLVAAEPRIRAAIFGGGFFVYESQLAAAGQITVPVQFLLPWDDEQVDRQSSLELFDAFSSPEKTLHANPGDHRNIRWTGVDDTFLHRHLS
jgi:alpha-beta hydrolase superfamily lysophospholipase